MAKKISIAVRCVCFLQKSEEVSGKDMPASKSPVSMDEEVKFE
jgi:hypothetical protein